MWVSWRRDLSTGTNETLVHCIFEEESFIAVHVYCILVVVAHSTGTISVAQLCWSPSFESKKFVLVAQMPISVGVICNKLTQYTVQVYCS